MTQYVAKTNTGIYPFGIVRKGDVLERKHLDALGETGLSVLIANGVIGEMREEAAAFNTEVEIEATSSVTADAATPSPEGKAFEEDFEDGEELTDLEGLDDLAGEGPLSGADVPALPVTGASRVEPPAVEETPAPKKSSRKRTGGKKQ